MKTKTVWKGAHKFDSFQNNGKLELEPGVGFNPKALLLTALAGCSAIDVVDILEKMRIPFGALSVDAEAEQTDTDPKVLKDIHLHYFLQVDIENRSKVEKAINLSLEKYCGVATMLRKTSAINYTLTISEDKV